MVLELGPLLKQINERMQAAADEGMAKCDLTLAQARVLGFLDYSGGQATQKDIEVHLAVSHPTVVGIVSRMEKKGFITSHPDSADRRNKIVCLTQKAIEISDQIKAGIANAEAWLLRGFTDDEKALLKCLLERLLSNISLPITSDAYLNQKANNK